MANNRRLTALSVKFLNVTDNFKVRGVPYPSPESLINLDNLKWTSTSYNRLLDNQIGIFCEIGPTGKTTIIKETLNLQGVVTSNPNSSGGYSISSGAPVLKINGDAGTNTQVLTSDASGGISWQNPVGGSGTGSTFWNLVSDPSGIAPIPTTDNGNGHVIIKSLDISGSFVAPGITASTATKDLDFTSGRFLSLSVTGGLTGTICEFSGDIKTESKFIGDISSNDISCNIIKINQIKDSAGSTGENGYLATADGVGGWKWTPPEADSIWEGTVDISNSNPGKVIINNGLDVSGGLSGTTGYFSGNIYAAGITGVNATFENNITSGSANISTTLTVNEINIVGTSSTISGTNINANFGSGYITCAGITGTADSRFSSITVDKITPGALISNHPAADNDLKKYGGIDYIIKKRGQAGGIGVDEEGWVWGPNPVFGNWAPNADTGGTLENTPADADINGDVLVQNNFTVKNGNLLAKKGDPTPANPFLVTLGDRPTNSSGQFGATGNYSMAMGTDNSPYGAHSTTIGRGNTGVGDFSTTIGENNKAEGNHSIVIGESCKSEPLAKYSFAQGFNSQSEGIYSFASGANCYAGRTGCYAFGSQAWASDKIKFAFATGDTVCEAGEPVATDCVNNNVFVIDDEGNVGISLGSGSAGSAAAPQATLDVSGNIRVNIEGFSNQLGYHETGPSVSYGANVNAYGTTSIGYNTTASGDYAIAMGNHTIASNSNCMAMGNTAKATGVMSTAMGWASVSSALISTAMGSLTKARGAYSTAMGSATDASGIFSTAMGQVTAAWGDNSTAMGLNTIASGAISTAMGKNTTASGDYSTAMGNETTADGGSCTAMGYNTTASGSYSTAMGYYTDASGNYSTAMGEDTIASGDYSTAMGYQTTAWGDYSTAMGESTNADGGSCVAMGYNTTASVAFSTAMGCGTTASDECSTAMGMDTTASKAASTAMGSGTTASGYASTAMGESTTASGDTSTAMGYNTDASGNYSTAMGYNTIASGNYSTAIGNCAYAGGTIQFAVGASSSGSLQVPTVTDNSNALVILDNGKVGIGTDAPTAELDVSGSVKISSALIANNTSGTNGQYLKSTGTGIEWAALAVVGVVVHRYHLEPQDLAAAVYNPSGSSPPNGQLSAVTPITVTSAGNYYAQVRAETYYSSGGSSGQSAPSACKPMRLLSTGTWDPTATFSFDSNTQSNASIHELTATFTLSVGDSIHLVIVANVSNESVRNCILTLQKV